MNRARLAALAVVALHATGLAQAQTAPAPPAPPPAATTPAPPPIAAPAPAGVRQPSLHVRCDGRPPQMSGGESFARFLGAVTLLGLFAPQPEQADASKRLLGAEGIAVCSELIDGPHAESNGLRRLQLILARAIHRLEAKDYPGALADVEKSRGEAVKLGLVGNPYFDQSFGLSFDLLGAQAKYLMGDAEGARATGLRTAAQSQFGFFPMVSGVSFTHSLRTGSPAEDAAMSARDRVMKTFVQAHASRLEELGRFAEAAQLRDALTTMNANLNSEATLSWLKSTAALSWALTGNWAHADTLAKAARDSIDAADADGKPDPARGGVIEVLDLYAVLKAAHEGRIDDARRSYAARSEWTWPSFGVLTATTTLLREGAKPDQLTGALAQSADAMWKSREDKSMARFLKQIADGKTEFGNIMPFARIDEYEKTARRVWKDARTGVISDNLEKNSKFYRLKPRELEPIYRVVVPDSLLLDAALIARARGYKGFVYIGSNQIWSDTFVEFGNPGDPDMLPQFYIDAEAVIAELRPLIPSPEDLAAREKTRRS